MYSECRHIMPSGKKCQAAALKGELFCYFHTSLHRMAKAKPGPMDSIEIPILEDRCAIQLAIAQILSALINGTIDHQRASLLLRGLRIASQNVDRRSWAIPIGTIKSLTRTRDGEELAPEQSECEYPEDCPTCAQRDTCDIYNDDDDD